MPSYDKASEEVGFARRSPTELKRQVILYKSKARRR